MRTTVLWVLPVRGHTKGKGPVDSVRSLSETATECFTLCTGRATRLVAAFRSIIYIGFDTPKYPTATSYDHKR